MLIQTRPRVASLLVLIAIALCTLPTAAQKIDDATRNKNREKLAELLASAGPSVHMTFQQSKAQPYNYSAYLTEGLKNVEGIDVVVGTTDVDTYSVNAYPKLKGAYLSVDKVKNPAALMRQLLALNHRTFLHWGIDSTGDVFMGFTITLESGFPDEAIRTVLRSIVVHDRFIAELLPSLR